MIPKNYSNMLLKISRKSPDSKATDIASIALSAIRGSSAGLPLETTANPFIFLAFSSTIVTYVVKRAHPVVL